MMISRRRLLIGMLTSAVIGVSGCSFSERARLRSRLRRGAPDGGLFNDALAEKSTQVEPVTMPALRGWQIVDVTYQGSSHPLRWFVAVTTEGDPVAVFLSGNPARWDKIIADAEVDSGELAQEVARVWFDATRSMQSLQYRIESADDIKWPTKPGPKAEAAKKRLTQTYAIKAPQAERVAAGWRLTLWTMDDQTLIEHQVVVSENAQVTDTATIREKGVPAAIGL